MRLACLILKLQLKQENNFFKNKAGGIAGYESEW